MKKIGILSDTHAYLDEAVFRHLEDCDEVWHAGDFGSMEVVTKLQAFKPLSGVWGNIDSAEIRQEFPEQNRFYCEEVDVLMIHIGGYPGKYAPGIRETLKQHPPKLFITGHSHILKVIFDEKLQCLHINPGAAGKHGWHQVRTLVKLTIDGAAMRDCQVIELGKRATT